MPSENYELHDISFNYVVGKGELFLGKATTPLHFASHIQLHRLLQVVLPLTKQTVRPCHSVIFVVVICPQNRPNVVKQVLAIPVTSKYY